MHRTTAAVLIALAFTAGNIAAPSADDLRLKPSRNVIQVQPVQNKAQLKSSQDKLQLKPSQSPAAPAGPQNLQAQPFPANCVAGFQKYDEKKTIKAGVPVVASFSCRTAWIECPNFPAFAQTWITHDIEEQATGNEGKRFRFKYTCMGYDPEG